VTIREVRAGDDFHHHAGLWRDTLVEEGTLKRKQILFERTARQASAPTYKADDRNADCCQDGSEIRTIRGRYGKVPTMVTTMDPAGRLVIPSEIRREASLQPGVPLEVRLRDGVIEIEPLPIPVKLQRKRRLLVATPTTAVPPLRASTVEQTRAELASIPARKGSMPGKRRR
jgi:AbrB family looped-hinge helix DNA binding protein